MPFQHVDVKAGDPVRSAEWNAMGAEVARLGTDKISRTGEESLDGPLTVRGALMVGAGGIAGAGGSLSVRGGLSVGTSDAGASVRVVKSEEDGKDPAHGALVLGTDAATSATLRIGYSDTYSWLQGQGEQALAINPYGGNVGIGTTAPGSRLAVAGNAAVGAAYARSAVPADGLIVQGNVGIGTNAPGSRLAVTGNAAVGAAYARSAAPVDGLIVQGSVGIGTATPQRPLHVQGEEVHSGGHKAGFSFSNRETTEFAHNGNAGERWVWLSENKVACLWSGKKLMTVDAEGTLTAGGWSTFSSREIKKDIVVLDERGAAEILNGLEPMRYRLIDDGSGAEQLGFIAEEVPQAVAGRDRRTVSQARIVAVLTRVVKDQQRRLDELTARLNERK